MHHDLFKVNVLKITANLLSVFFSAVHKMNRIKNSFSTFPEVTKMKLVFRVLRRN